MELLGNSLEDIFQNQQKKYSIKTVCMIGIQMIDRLEFIHSKNIIHRDIKPDNFTIGMDNKSHIIYALDFGLSKKYRSSRTHQHIKYNVNKKLTGTARYASINALKGTEQSRRDDLEAIGYVLMYFLRGSLPWQGLHVHKGEDRYKKILAKKRGTTAEELCRGFPKEFADYINYTRNMEFEVDPDYKYLRGLLLAILEKEHWTYDFWYDWVKEKPNITNDKVAIERYMKNNYTISLELSGDDKKEKEGETKDKENPEEKENNMNMNYSGLNTVNSNNDISIPTTQYSSEVVKANNAGINIPVDNNNNISSNSIGKNDESLDKKDSRKNKKNKKDKNKNGETEKKYRNCLIW